MSKISVTLHRRVGSGSFRRPCAHTHRQEELINMTPVMTCLTAAGLMALSQIPRGADGQNFRPANRIIEGRVTDIGGKPVSGARVMLRADDHRMQPNGVIVLTGPDGRYSADISRYEWSRSPLRCRALAEGFAYAKQAVAAGSARATADYSLKPEKWRTTTVRLADPSGRPVPGMPVSCSIDDLPWLTLTTDWSGRCAVASAIGQAIVLQVKPESFRPVRATLLNGKDDAAEVTVALRAPIVGRVHDEAGRPLEGITVGRLIREDRQKNGRGRAYPQQDRPHGCGRQVLIFPHDDVEGSRCRGATRAQALPAVDLLCRSRQTGRSRS